MKTRVILISITFLCAAMASVQSTRAAVIKVTNTNDSGPGSLRGALAVANDGDTIDATGVSGTILLTSGELQITHSVTITGPGPGNLAVNGNATFTVFVAFFAGDATISGFTVTNGASGIGTSESGTLAVNNCTISGNSGPGISNHDGTITVSNCSISGNSADAGGGISNVGGGALGGVSTVTVSNSTICGNSADSGGGILNVAGDIGEGAGATMTLSNSTVSGNSAVDGGGIYNTASGLGGATMTLSNSTISGNSADAGGGISNVEVGGAFLGGVSTVTVSNSTISGNSATGNGGGIYNSHQGRVGSTVLNLGSTIFNVGGSGENIFNDGGTVTSLGYNLSSDDGGGLLTGPGDQINTDPILGPLQDNGGPTFTHALLPGSPAIDAGDPNFTPPPDFDQRGPGFPRVVAARIDIGSFEVQMSSTPTPTATATITATPTATATTTPSATPRQTPTPRFLPTPRPRPTLASRPTP